MYRFRTGSVQGQLDRAAGTGGHIERPGHGLTVDISGAGVPGSHGHVVDRRGRARRHRTEGDAAAGLDHRVDGRRGHQRAVMGEEQVAVVIVPGLARVTVADTEP